MIDLSISLLAEEDRNQHANTNFTKIIRLPTCFLCEKTFFYVSEFTYTTSENKPVCEYCAVKKDPQLVNIMLFICKGTYDFNLRLKKFEMGLPKLRELIAGDDPKATVCPICEEKRVRSKQCSACGFFNMGQGLFRYQDKVFNFYKAKRALKLKAFL